MEFLPETENGNDGNKDWFLHILQTWLVKQGGQHSLENKSSTFIIVNAVADVFLNFRLVDIRSRKINDETHH